MCGIELRKGTLVVEREPYKLNDLSIRLPEILDRFDIDHVYIAGYVSIFAGRSRSTEDVDVLFERIDEETANEFTATFDEESFWGPKMPLTSMYGMLDNGDNIWLQPVDQITPHL